MRVFDFTHAIVREPGRSVVNGLREDASAAPTYAGVRAQHAAYVAALRDAGLVVDVLPPQEDYPDSVFVEDPALVFTEGAILMRPGAPSRVGERDDMRGVLHRHFDRVLELADDEWADGGDVLVTREFVFIGLSKRTTEVGARALATKLQMLGHRARIARTPPSVLHFKSVSALVSEDTILTNRAMADSDVFAGFNTMIVPDGEDLAANLIRVNDVVFAGDCYPRTIDMLGKAGFAVRALDVNDIVKLDAGLSCMSLRWAKT